MHYRLPCSPGDNIIVVGAEGIGENSPQRKIWRGGGDWEPAFSSMRSGGQEGERSHTHTHPTAKAQINKYAVIPESSGANQEGRRGACVRLSSCRQRKRLCSMLSEGLMQDLAMVLKNKRSLLARQIDCRKDSDALPPSFCVADPLQHAPPGLKTGCPAHLRTGIGTFSTPGASLPRWW